MVFFLLIFEAHPLISQTVNGEHFECYSSYHNYCDFGIEYVLDVIPWCY